MGKIIKTVIVILLAITSCKVEAQRITVTLAGNGSGGFGGDGYPSYLSEIYSPYDVCMDAADNLYFIDRHNSRIRKISAKDGIITTVAGGGGSLVDGIAATSAAITPKYLCSDSAGNLYVSTDNRIRKISSATGIITTIVGTDSANYTGDGGAATAATLNDPLGVCVDHTGNIYIADNGNNRIRKVTAATGFIITVADSFAGNELYPIAICVNAFGDVFFSDWGGSYIRKISSVSGSISTIAGNGETITASGNGGPATNACIGMVHGICVDGFGNLYLTEISCSCRKIDIATGIIDIAVGSMVWDGYNGDGINSVLSWLNQPIGVCVDRSGNIYVADQLNNRIRKSIQLTHAPTFAYGNRRQINPCPETTFLINTQMAVTDLDSGQTENWTIISSPLHGTLSGFPYAAATFGTSGLNTPAGLSYTPNLGFSGVDSFVAKVSDGTLSDTIVVYVSVPLSTPSMGAISGLLDSLCIYQTITLLETITAGEWAVSNQHATIDGAGNLQGLSNGIDTITYKVLDGCAVTANGVVYVYPYFDAGFIYGMDSIYSGLSTVLSDAVTGGTWWSLDPTIATVSATGVAQGVSPGLARVIYCAPTPCGSDTAYFGLAVLPATGVQNIPPNSIYELSIKPNPSKGQFTILVSASSDEQIIVTITNLLGEKLKEISAQTNERVDVLFDMLPGIYLLSASTSSGKLGGKLIIQ